MHVPLSDHLDSREDGSGGSKVTDLTNAFGEIRLSLHWYSGNVETEEFSLNDLGRISLEDFRRDTTTLGDETTMRCFS